MTRFRGQALSARCRIAVVANDAIGNFVVVTPLLQMLRDRYDPDCIHYYGGRRTWEMQSASSLIDSSEALWGLDPREAVGLLARKAEDTPYDLVVNVEATAAAKFCAGLLAGPNTLVCGPCVAPDGRGDLRFADDERGALWADPEWTAADLTVRYPFLASSFIGELFCRLCYLEGAIPGYNVPVAQPTAEIPDLLISTAAGLPEKLWTQEGWITAIRWACGRDMSVGLLGARPAAQATHWHGCSVEDELVARGGLIDLRGKLTLPEVAGALSRAKAVLTLDNGILHLAAAVGAPTVGLFREGIHRLWAPPVPTLKVITSAKDGLVADVPPFKVLEALEVAV